MTKSPWHPRIDSLVCTALVLVSTPLLVAATAFMVAQQPASQKKPNRRLDNCTDMGCHANVKEKKKLHGPVAQNQCLSCHDYLSVDDHLFNFTQPSDELCVSCHEIKLNRVVHQPVADNNCVGCHDPHGSDEVMLLKQNPTKGLCSTCHSQDFAEKEFVHGPVAVGACIVCHQPHSSNQKALLSAAPDKLCIDCHSEVDAKTAGVFMQHAPMEEGCTSCHDPHATDHPFQLVEKVPNLCLSCHDNIERLLDRSLVKHGPVNEDGGCVACHSPHFSNLKYLQKDTQPALCLRCHDEEIKTSDDRTLTNMEKLLKEHPNHHGPIRNGNCAACHKPHAGDEQNLLYKSYPPEFYAPFSMERYSLCFSCHMSDLVKDASGAGLTRFRNGDINLHYTHVNKEKGRTCRACHEVHASDRPAHIREAVPYGKSGWMLEINFLKTDSGGSCAPACHKAKDYDRINPVIVRTQP